MSVCACEPSGQPGGGIAPCLYHARVFTEHRLMYRALQGIGLGDIVGQDPGEYAKRVLSDVKYRHGR